MTVIKKGISEFMNAIKGAVLADLTHYKKGRKRRKRRHIKSEILEILKAYKKENLSDLSPR